MREPVAQASPEEWSEARQAVFAELRSTGIDTSRIADLLLRYGPALLDRDIPYLIVALRRAGIDEHRREVRQALLARQLGRESAPFTAADPATIVESKASLEGAIAALSSLAEADAWALWWHAGGLPDEEIAQRWTEAGFEPSSPSLDLIRKRRQRARAQLRELVSDS